MGTMAPKSKALPAGAVLLARWRGRNKLSQVEASKILSLDTGTYSSIEGGKITPGMKRAARIASGTGGSVPIASWVES